MQVCIEHRRCVRIFKSDGGHRYILSVVWVMIRSKSSVLIRLMWIL